MAVKRPKLPVRPNAEPHIVIDGVVCRARPCGVLIDGSTSRSGVGLIGPDGTPFEPCGQVKPLTEFSEGNNVESTSALCSICDSIRVKLSKKNDDIAAHADIKKRYGYGNWTDGRAQEHGALLGLTGGRLTGERAPGKWNVGSGKVQLGAQLATFNPITVDDVEIEFGSIEVSDLAKGKAHHEGWTVQKMADLVKARWPERNMRLTGSWFMTTGGRQLRHLQFTGTLNIDGIDIEMTRYAQMNQWKHCDPFKDAGYSKNMPGWFYIAINNETGAIIFGITNDLQQRWDANYGKRDRTILVAIRIEDGNVPQAIESGIKAATDAYHSPCSAPFDGEVRESLCDTHHARLTLGTMIDEAHINHPDTSRVVFCPDLSPLDYRVDTGEPELEWADYNSDAWWEDDVVMVGSTNVALTA